MANLFPSQPIIETLTIDKGKLLVFTPLTEEEYTALKAEHDKWKAYPKLSPKRDEMDKAFKNKYGVMFYDIIALGDTVMETRLANQYIENTTLRCAGIEKRNYKCFVHSDWRQHNCMNLPHHEDGGCSWNCLMEKLKHPEYGVIYTKEMT